MKIVFAMLPACAPADLDTVMASSWPYDAHLRSVSAVHLASEQPSVDVYADEVLIRHALTPLTAEALEAPSDAVEVSFVAAGGDLSAPLARATLPEGEVPVTVALTAGGAALVLVDDPAGLDAGHQRLQVGHAAPRVEALDVTLDGGPGLLALRYGDALPLVAPARAVALGLDVDRDGAPERVYPLEEARPGSVLDLFVLEDAAGAPVLLARRPDGVLSLVAAE